MTLTGDMLIGAAAVRGQGTAFRGFDVTGATEMAPDYFSATPADVDRACTLAASAFDAYRAVSLEARAVFLETVAQNIVDIGDALIERAVAESGLPRGRIEGERGRTVGQLKMFAALVRSGDALDARIEPALPDRKPLARPDIRLLRIPIGPVAVFGASNFPLAFSVAGGDTASALAAGCPVVVKGHSAHPGTSELVGRAIQRAVQQCELPEGVFSLLFDAGYEAGTALVAHPAIKGVGFTGSRSGGLALMKVAAARREPIPVYAEMSSINPVFLLPEALAARADTMGRNYVDSLTMGNGQFCTNPGIVLGVAGVDFDRFVATATESLTGRPHGVMLTRGIAQAYAHGAALLAGNAQASRLATGAATASEGATQALLFKVSGSAFLADESLAHEVFGPLGLLVECSDFAQMKQVAERLEGQLTATLQMDDGDTVAARALLPVLERKVGRILVNGYPTGVEVCDAMVHGGPFPATSDGRSTSVGTAAIERFMRPVSYQNLPDALMPDALRDGNPLGLARRIAAVPQR
ncbi:MAG: 2,5-dioxovalerate dehydrogenase [Rhizobacter sp.]|nr:2,5-dioxovalerate dehydrogenase [Rhizobacter sp.]